jgi:hypothetical protein
MLFSADNVILPKNRNKDPMNNKSTRPSALRGFAVSALTLAILSTTAVTAVAAEPTNVCTPMKVNVFQAVNPTSKASILTTSANEITSAAKYSFTENKGTAFKAATTPKEGLVPVHRMFKNGDFVWMPKHTGSNEYQTAQTKYGYTDQGVNFFASVKPVDCGVPVYRLLNGSKHRQVATTAERDALVKAGWKYENISFYVVPADKVVAPTPAPTTPIPTPAPTTPAPTTPPVVTPPVVTPAPTPVPTINPNDADKKFSIAVIPDTQQEVGTDTRFAQRNQWLVQNKATSDLRYVIHTGDVVNWDTPTHNQYEVASKAMKVLDDAKIPQSLAIGNHDTAAVGVGGSAADPTRTRQLVRDTSTFNSYFNTSRYQNINGTFEAGKIDNNYTTFRAGGGDWLVLTLELWPREAAVQWAKKVVAEHPHHNVIVNTHSYLEGNSTIGTSGSYGDKSPQYLYDNLIKVYPNIKMVFSGHVGEAGYREDTGVNGNKIVSYLGTFHSGSTNPVRMLEIDTEKGTLTTKFFGPSNGSTWVQYDRTTTGFTLTK